MMNIPERMKLIGSAAAVALVFNTATPAQADELVAHPLLGGDAAPYMFRLSKAPVEKTGDVTASNRTGGFTKTLEEKLRAGPLDRPQSVSYPPSAKVGQIIISAVVPPRSQYATANIPVCAERGDRIVATYTITPKGDVVPDPWAGGSQPATTDATSGKVEILCKPYLMARGKAMMQTDPAQPPPMKAENPASPRTEAAR